MDTALRKVIVKNQPAKQGEPYYLDRFLSLAPTSAQSAATYQHQGDPSARVASRPDDERIHGNKRIVERDKDNTGRKRKAPP